MPVYGLYPNTTQIPNFLLDNLFPRLKESEIRVLLVVLRQTFGWIEDQATGRRKEKDWISRSQMAFKTGKSVKSMSRAIDSLIKEGLLIAYNDKSQLLDTAAKRKFNFGKVFYRFNQNYGNNMLFKVTHKKRPVSQFVPRKFVPLQN